MVVYVDGFVAATSLEVTDRVWVPQPFNAAPHLVVGRITATRMYSITHMDEVLDDQGVFEGKWYMLPRWV